MIKSNESRFSDLAAAIDGDVAHTELDRYLVAGDGSIYLRQPAVVVYPRTRTDVGTAIRFAGDAGITIHARGAGSGLCGSAVGDGMVIDFTRHMNRLLDLDTEAGRFTCEPGLRRGELDTALTGSGFFFPPDPSSGEYATFGGMTATNASGAHSVKYGNTADYLLDAEFILADGSVHTLSEIHNTPSSDLPTAFQPLHALYLAHAEQIEAAYPPVRYNSAGYNLRQLVVNDRLALGRLICGAEGTLVVTTRLTFRLLPAPTRETLVVAFMPDIITSAEAVQDILPMGPSGIEIMDRSLLDMARNEDPVLAKALPSDADNVLMVAFDNSNGVKDSGASDAADDLTAAHLAHDRLATQYNAEAHLAATAEEKERFWAVRKAAVPILYRLKGDRKILALVEDAAVPTDQLVPYFKGIYRIFETLNVPFVTYGHIAKGLMHTRPLLNLKDPADVARLRPIADAVYDLVAGLGGTVSGEHGDGRLRSAYIRRRYPEIFHLFEKVKTIFDPAHRLNPELLLADDPDQMARHLRYGADYQRRETGPAHLHWPDSWETEIERCHGCSQCTTVTHATRMCPMYKATRLEAASPKAKANALRGLISGALSPDWLFERRFQEVMRWCVNCGSCAKECPSRVNIPKMALEARARYSARYGVAPGNRLMASVELAARWTHKLAPVMTPLANLSLSRWTLEQLAGISRHRPPVQFATRSLADRSPSDTGGAGPTVLYYAGCYAGYIEPAIGKAAMDVLSAMGYRVLLPRQHCCGLPMLSKAMVPEAAGRVRANQTAWGRLLDSVDHVVVTCSSCGHALTGEWADIADPAFVEKLGPKVVHITALVRDGLARLPLADQDIRAGYHLPCHLKIQNDPTVSVDLLGRLPGVTVTDLAAHCCGMVGSWGLAAANETLSRQIGDDLMTRWQAADTDIGTTDCPTCRLQMAQLGHQPVMHPIEIIAAAMRPSS